MATDKPQTFCPVCENDLLEDARAFGYDGPIRTRKSDPADDEPVLCERHAAEYPTVCLCGAPVARPGDYTCGNPECVVASDEADHFNDCDCPRCSGHPEEPVTEEEMDAAMAAPCANCSLPADECRCSGPCEFCGKDGHNGGCRAQERHDARCL